MIERVTINLALPPQGKARARYSKKLALATQFKKTHFTPDDTVAYENAIKVMARIAMRGRALIDVPCGLDMRAVYPIPASWSQKKRNRAITGEIRPGVKPDLSNVLKAWEDAMNGIVLVDDALIVEYGHIKKVYGVTPLVEVTIRDLAS